MFHSILVRRLVPPMLCLAAGFVPQLAQAGCRPVNGHYSEQLLAGPTCASAVGVCIQGSYSGVLHGSFFTQVDTFTATTDTPQTQVSLFTAGSQLHVALAGRQGTLMIRNAGAVRGAGSGEIVDVQTVVGGTGELAGASGVITAVGTFTFAEGGRSEYGGTVCLPGAF